jgi:23S rRNA (adenine2503-C2)-methyltransferase
MLINFFDYTLSDLKETFEAKGFKPFRAGQIYKWVYQKEVLSPELMTDLSLDFRSELPQFLSFNLPEIVDHRMSTDGTQKFLFDVGDGLTVETVMIPTDSRKTLCVSSEVGCNLGCKFCYTGKEKLKKRLSAGQIIGQFVQVQNVLKQQGQTGLTNIVFMGMGEPLDNPKAVFDTIEILNEPSGLNFSRKRVTVSTSGIVPLIPLITQSRAVLAVSLNGSNDEVRSEVMPVNKRWNIQELLKACQKHISETGDDVTFEYVLLKGVTDQDQHARELSVLLRNMKCKVNLIPFNEHPGSGYYRPDAVQVKRFQNILVKNRIQTYVRQTRGEDIYAACGQLNAVNKEHPQYL